MTKKELEQLIDLKEEIDELERNIAKLEQMDIKSVPVKVDASCKGFPYIQGRATIQVCDPEYVNKKARLLFEKEILLVERKERAVEEEKRLMEYINNVKESRIRRIMQYRYIDGYTWERIGEVMNCDRTTAEKMITRYLKKNNDPE